MSVASDYFIYDAQYSKIQYFGDLEIYLRYISIFLPVPIVITKFSSPLRDVLMVKT